MKLYMSEGAIWIMLLIYTPLALLALWGLWKTLSRQGTVRVSVMLFAVGIATLLPTWDVLTTSYQMAQLCPTAGLRVRKSVEVEGYLTNFGGNLGEISHEGFSYIESQTRSDTLSLFKQHDGKVLETIIDLRKTAYPIKSRYEYRYGSGEKLEGALNIAKAHSLVIDRATQEILGEAVSYTAFPGWIDRNSIQRLGNFSWSCPEKSAISADLLEQTLRPARR
ncbi:MAG: hypothetical protein WAO95_12790 [Burkholderiales bacterium]